MRKNNIKLKIVFSTLDQSYYKHKALIVSLLGLALTLLPLKTSQATKFEEITLKKEQAITTLRRIYNSPVKKLDKIINKTSNTPQQLPMYSHIKAKSFIDKTYSKTKPTKTSNEKPISLFSWVSNNDSYSRLGNDPLYASNISINKSNEPSSFDYNNIDTSITTLDINDKVAYDFEVITWPDGSISVPIKTLAELLDVPITQNHINHNISFIHPVTNEEINIDCENNKILIGTSLIEIKNPKLIYLKEGFLIQDDIFIPAFIAKDILDASIDFNEESYKVALSTNRVLKAFVEISESVSQPSKFVHENNIKEIREADPSSNLFNIRNLTYNLSSSMNSSSGSGNNYSNAMANAGFNLTGNLLGGEYNIGANTSYGQNGLNLNGYRASLDFIKPKYELSIGSTDTQLSDLTVSAANIWGFRLGSVGANSGISVVPRLIEGTADDNTYVELYVNNVYSDRQMVNNGRFIFDSLNYPSTSMVDIRVEQISNDGSKKVVYDRSFSQNRNLLAPGQRQFLVFSGLDTSAIANSINLFGDKFSRDYVQPIKYVSGAKFRTGISENMTVGVNFAQDFIIRNPSKNLLQAYKNMNSPRIYRSSRGSSGSVISLDLDYAATENLHLSSELAMSFANSKIDPYFEPSGSDIGGFLSAEYKKRDYNLNLKVFNYGSDFYSPNSRGLIDKKGFEVNSTWKVGNVQFAGGATRYNANLDNYFEGGQSSIFDYNLYASGKIDDFSNLRAGVRSTGAKNSIYDERNTTFDITINRQLSKKADLTINYAKTFRKSSDLLDNSNIKTSNNRINASLTYDAGKIGVVRLAHEMMSLDPVDRLIMAEYDNSFYQEPIYSKNLRITLDRSRLPIKGITFSPNLGYRYDGNNKGINFGCSLGYMFRNGRQLVLNYAYNSSFGRYMSGALSFGGSKSHTLSFNFVDTLGFGINKSFSNNKYKTTFDTNSGIIKGCVFLDKNRNGIKDIDEEGLSGIDITLQGLFDISTDKEGNYIAPNVPSGLRKIGLNRDSLPVIYTPTVADALVKVQKQKVYVVDLGLIITPGSISGQAVIEEGNPKNSDIIVVLLNEEGNEVKYTTTDTLGNFYIDAIAPGKYTVVIDDNFLSYKHMKVEGQNKYDVEIPFVLDDFVDIDGINFNLAPKPVEVKKF